MIFCIQIIQKLSQSEVWNPHLWVLQKDANIGAENQGKITAINTCSNKLTVRTCKSRRIIGLLTRMLPSCSYCDVVSGARTPYKLKKKFFKNEECYIAS